jgi:hypothetical protein
MRDAGYGMRDEKNDAGGMMNDKPAEIIEGIHDIDHQ